MHRRGRSWPKSPHGMRKCYNNSSTADQADRDTRCFFCDWRKRRVSVQLSSRLRRGEKWNPAREGRRRRPRRRTARAGGEAGRGGEDWRVLRPGRRGRDLIRFALDALEGGRALGQRLHLGGQPREDGGAPGGGKQQSKWPWRLCTRMARAPQASRQAG